MTPAELPLEILESIAGRISKTDVKTCSCVCHGWQSAFQKELWRRAAFWSHKWLVSFAETITNPEHNAFDFGQYTRDLTFHKQAKLTVPLLVLLQNECKGVSKLEFEKGSADRGCFTSPLNWEAWKDLEDLTMFLDGITRTDFLRSLSYLPKLKSLALPSDMWDSHEPFTFEYVNAIHQRVPHLESFTMVGNFDALTNADIIALPKVSKTQVVSLTTRFYTTQLMWIVYWAYKHPQIQTLRWHMDVYSGAASGPDPDIVSALEDIPVAFKCLENLHITGVDSKTWPFQAFFNLLARSKTALRTLFYTVYIHPSNPLSVIDVLQAASRSTAASLTGLQLKISGILDDTHLIPMSLHGFHKLTRVEILGENTCLAIDMLLDNCPNLDDLSMTASSLVLNTTETPISGHILKKLRIEKAVMEAKILNYISARCLNLKNMYLLEVNVYGKCPDSEPARRLFDMHYTNFEELSINKTTFFNLPNSTCTPDKRVNLLCVRKGGREDDKAWHHIYSLSSIIYSRTSCQQLSEEATAKIKSFYESPDSVEIPDSTRFENGCVKKECWSSDLIRGYVLIECGSVQQLVIE